MWSEQLCCDKSKKGSQGEDGNLRTGVTDDNVAHKMTPSERHRGSSQSHSFTFRATKLLQCRTEPLKIIKPQKNAKN